MATGTGPNYATTPLVGSGVLSATADTGYGPSAPSHTVTVVTAGASASKIDEIRYQGNGTTVAGTITVFRYNGSTYFLVDCINVPAVTASTTAAPWQLIKSYPNLNLAANDVLACSSTVANQLVCVTAEGGSY
jgi:hypothetical protein